MKRIHDAREFKALLTRSMVLLLIFLFCASVPAEHALGDIYTASYKTYDTTYEDILKMYLRVMPAQCREQSRRRHDLYNEFMYDDLSPRYMEDLMTPEYDRLDDAGKAAKRKELQEKTLQYMKSKVGYSIQDINGDGTEELLIGSGKSYIYELFTIEDGKVRELIKAGYRYSCNLLKDGSLFRFASNGAGFFGDILFRMNGTGPVQFVKGYYYNGDLGYANNLNDECWFRITDARNFSANTMDQHVPSSEVNSWVAECESNYANIRFIPFAAYEKGVSGEGIAVISVNGKTSGSQTVRIRKEANSKSKILAQKKVGTYLKAIDTEGDYYQVVVDNKTGYVHKNFITVITDLPESSAQE